MDLFEQLRKLYDNDDFCGLLKADKGVYWLKLRSISRTEMLRSFCEDNCISFEGIENRDLFRHVFNIGPSEEKIDAFIRKVYSAEREQRRSSEERLIAELYKMRTFDWGGLYQNSLEQTIVNNYVKKITEWDKLNDAIDNDLQPRMRGYVQCSWYNHWTSIIIEDIFKDHPKVLPAVGLIKKVDFFIYNFPFDLKVTYFPTEYMTRMRRSVGLSPEITEIKRFARAQGMHFETDRNDNELLLELLDRIREDTSQSAADFLSELVATRRQIVEDTMKDPVPLIRWLYENQGVRRFDASSRLFLILVDLDNLEESWKLKRNKPLIAAAVNKYLDSICPDRLQDLLLSFEWNGNTYETYADALFVTRSAKNNST